MNSLSDLLAELPWGADAAASVAWSPLNGQVETATRGCTPGGLFQAGSISKSIAAAAMLGLVDRGRVRLDLPVNDAMDGWSLRTPDGTRSTATFRQLLAHTAGVTVHGFPGYHRGAAVPNLDDVLEGRAPAVNESVRAAPDLAGTFGYSGGGYCVLQRALVDLTGVSYSAFVHRSVLEPAGMRSATFSPETGGRNVIPGSAGGSPVAGGSRTYPELAAAGLCCTATDLVRFGLFMVRSVRSSEPHQSSVFATDMVRPHSATYALGLELLQLPSRRRLLGHAGSNRGFKSMFAFDAEAGAAAAVMVNDDRATYPARAAVLDAALRQATR